MRLLFSIVYVVLIAALALCAVFARRSGKQISGSVAWLTIALIPPVIGNLILLISNLELLSVIGCYVYFLGMDLVMYALLRFTFDYCAITWPSPVIKWAVYGLLLLDGIQMLCNPFLHHAFGVEAIEVDGSAYFRLLPYLGQSFHRVVDYGIFAAVLLIFLVKTVTAPRIYAKRFSVVFFSAVAGGLWQTFYIFSRTPVDTSMVGFGLFGLLVYYFAIYYRPMRLLDRMLVTVVSQMPEALFFLDPNGQCIWANRAAAELAGLQGDDYDLAPEHLRRLFGDFDRDEDWTSVRVTRQGESTQYYLMERNIIADEKGRPVGSFVNVRDITHDQETLQRETYNATHDSLTKVYNRAGYDQVLSQVDRQHTCMLLIDLDHFKSVNDTFGHVVGDRILQKTAGTISHVFRSDDRVCRIGGDEFVVFLVHTDLPNRDMITRRVQQINEALSDTKDGLPAVSVSVGAAYGGQAKSVAEWFKQVDSALYETKRRGRRGLTFFPDVPSPVG